MTPAFTVKAFGIYVLATGIGLTLAPNLVLAPLGVPETREVWLRMVGALAIVLGYYYLAAAAADARAFFLASVRGRFLFCALAGGLVLFTGAPWQILLFCVVDAAGALWTRAALHAQGGRAAKPDDSGEALKT